MNGRKKFKGVLKSLIDGLVNVECDGVVYAIAIDNVLRANLDR